LISESIPQLQRLQEHTGVSQLSFSIFLIFKLIFFLGVPPEAKLAGE
jgi:hypothetical protein